MRHKAAVLMLAVGVALAGQASAKSATEKSGIELRAMGGSAAFVSPQDLDGTIGVGVFADLGRIAPLIGLEPYVEFWSKSNDTFGGKASVSDISLGARGKYFFEVKDSKIRPFAGAGLGLHFINAKATFTSPGFPTIRSDASDTKLGLDLGGGIATPLSANDDLHIEAWYGIVSDVDQLALRVGFAHKLGL